jgi:hypothetical protein
MIPTWPSAILPSKDDVAFNIAWRSATTPSSVSGFSQAVSQDIGIWKASLVNIDVRKREKVNLFRTMADLMEGKANPILVPVCHGYQPFPANWNSDGVPHDDDAYFDDDSGYDGWAIDIRVISPGAVRATSFDIRIVTAGSLTTGQYFSVDNRLYRIRRISYILPNTATIEFRPSLRAAVFAGRRLNFDNPVCKMRALTDQEMDLELQMKKFGSPTVNFIEDMEPDVV